ncbi:hypothetical protein [Paenibacillus polysaccharolyticus]|uniref:hypothetical protein n=1 Tax=Paenibacillus polysaccharolyticus TaxID=582692 RepID=UPI0030082978
MENYKWAFHEVITELSEANIENRGERMSAVAALTDSYIEANGERPDVDALERLTNLILKEELSDMDAHKIQHNEYPFLSDRQFERRHDREVSLWVAENMGADGIDHKPRKKRMRSKWENAYMDRDIRTKNAARKAQYKKDTSPGAVVTYNLYENGGELTEPFVNCVGIGKRWANEMGAMNETEIVREETEIYVQEAA